MLIVGAGIVGLSTSLHLRRLGYLGRIVLVDKSTPGGGATGRCGGILYADDDFLPGSVGDLVFLRKSLQQLGLEHLIRSASGRLAGIHGEYDADVVDPLCLVNELADHAAHQGVEIYQEAELTSWTESGNHALLTVNGYNIAARVSLLATGCGRVGMVLEDLGIEVTEEECIVLEATSATIPWTYCGLGEGDDFVWGRRIGETYFLFGGGEKYSAPTDDQAARLECIRNGLRLYLPQLERRRVVAQWRESLCTFRDRRGWRVVNVPNHERVFFAGGFDGQGLLTGNAAGFRAAKTLLACMSRTPD